MMTHNTSHSLTQGDEKHTHPEILQRNTLMIFTEILQTDTEIDREKVSFEDQ